MEFVRLILAHLIGDFVLQPKSWVNEKEKSGLRSPKIYLHGFIHGALVLLVLWDLSYWPLALALAIIHLVIDLAKQHFQKENNKSSWFLIDQSLHLVSIFALWFLFFSPNLSLISIFENNLFWVYLTAIVFLTVACGIAIQIILENWTSYINFSKAESLPNAGKYIGICGQGPSDHPDLAEWLMDQGIDSISLNPDTVVDTWTRLAQHKKG